MKGGLSALSVMLESATKAVVTEQELMYDPKLDDPMASPDDDNDDDELAEITDETIVAVLCAMGAHYEGGNFFDRDSKAIAEDAAFLGRWLIAKQGRVANIAKRVSRNPRAATTSVAGMIKASGRQ